MEFKSIMHVSFFTRHFDEIRDFYENKLGLEAKMKIPYALYKGLGRGEFSQLAETEPPEALAFIYFEIAPGQFLEFFPAREDQGPHVEQWNRNAEYSHFALLVDDIFAVRQRLEARGVMFDTEISKGPTETWQMWMHDPDGNKFEIMQYTDKSLQLLGYGGNL